MKPLHIVFTGFFGAGNLGDEAILLSEVRELSLRCPGSSCVVASFNPDYHRALGLEAFDARDRDVLTKTIAEADLHIVGGGGLWADYWGWNPGDLFAPQPFNIAFYARGLLAASAVGTPSVVLANGVGPLRSDAARHAVASLLSLAATVSVRDASSADLVRAGGFLGRVSIASDPAYAIKPITIEPRSNALRIAIVPRFWSHGASADQVLTAVGEGVGGFVAGRDCEVVLLRFQSASAGTTEDDAGAIERVIDYLPVSQIDVSVVTPTSPEEAVAWLGSCDVTVTMRLHGAILSAVAFVPSVAIGVDPKLISNASRLGLSDLVAPIEQCSSPLICELVTRALDNRNQMALACQSGVNSARGLLDAAFDEAIACLGGGRTVSQSPRIGRTRFTERTCVFLRLPSFTEEEAQIEKARQAAHAAAHAFDDAVIAVGSRPVCQWISQDPQLARVALMESPADSFGSFLNAASIALEQVAPASADIVVIDAERFDARTALEALKRLWFENPDAALVSAPGTRDREAPETGAVDPDLGACRIKRDLWDETAASLMAFETASGCGTELARRARRQMLTVVWAPVFPETPDADSELDRDKMRGEARRPGSNAFFTIPPAKSISTSITKWIADRKVVVFPPTMGWTVPIIQRTNHMARALAEAGHAVIYSVEGVYSIDHGPAREVSPGVLAVSEPFASLGFLEDPIVFVYSYNVECASFFRHRRTVYEWIDDLSVFAGDQKLLGALHDVALKKADVVTAVAGSLWRKAIARREDAIYLPNGVWVADFDPGVAADEPLSEDDTAWFESDNRPVVIYWGAVAPWFDNELVAEVSRLRPDLRFAVLGPGLERQISSLADAAPSNLCYFGPRPYRLLASFARRAAAAMLPFCVNAITQATSPLKLYEYLAARLAVVSTPLPESIGIDRVLLASEPRSFAESLDQALALRGNADYSDWVGRFVACHDWSLRAATLRAKLGLSDVAPPQLLPPVCEVIELASSPEHVDPNSVLLRANLVRRDRELKSIRAELRERESELAATRSTVKERDDVIENLRQSFPQNAVRGVELTNSSSKAKATIESLRERLASQGSVLESLRNLLAADKQVIRELEPKLQEKRRTIETLETDLSEKTLNRRILAARLAAMGDQFEQVTASAASPSRVTYRASKDHYLGPFANPSRTGDGRSQPIAKVERDSLGPFAEVTGHPESTLEVRGSQGDVGSFIGEFTEIDTPRLAAHTYDLVCFPIIDWEFRFQRPQHLCIQFAQEGHRVFYLRTTFHQTGDKALLEHIHDGVYGVQLPGPADLNVYKERISDELQSYLIGVLGQFRLQTRISEAVSLVQLPFWKPLAFGARERWGWKAVYDCMDDHSGFSNNEWSMLDQEEALFAESDLVLTTSGSLLEKASALSDNVLLIPNACDFDHFNSASAGNPLADIGRPRIGYYGAISDWFDVEMIRNAATQRPNWEFVLIGHTTGADVSTIQKLNNVHLLGEKPYSELPGYLHGFDVALIPFVMNALTRATNPVKFYEYLSAGKPIVATELPDLQQYREYFYPVRTPDQFTSQVEAALTTHSSERVNKGIELARKNTWAARYQEISVSITQLRLPGGQMTE